MIDSALSLTDALLPITPSLQFTFASTPPCDAVYTFLPSSGSPIMYHRSNYCADGTQSPATVGYRPHDDDRLAPKTPGAGKTSSSLP